MAPSGTFGLVSILESLESWRLESSPETLPDQRNEGIHAPTAARIGNTHWLTYFPVFVAPWIEPYVLQQLPPETGFSATWINPRNGERSAPIPFESTSTGTWEVPFAPILQDWVLLVERQ